MIMKCIYIFSIGVFFVMASMPMSALADSDIRFKTSTLACGQSRLTVKTTYLVKSNIETQVLDQQLILTNTKTNQQKELKTDGKYIIKHLPEKHKVLDAAIEVWGCMKSNEDKYYFRLLYYCTSGEEKGICSPGKVEWLRFLREDGAPLIKSRRHWRITHSEDVIYKSLGLYDKSRIIQSKGIDE
jgi:hypothetical protein